jgi:Tfp pilus assembly protein PilO
MQKSSKSLVAILLGILILAVAYFGAYGQWQRLGEARAAFELSQKTNRDLKQAESDASSFLSKYENNLAEAALANRALPLGHPDVPGLLDNFSRMVRESGLTIQDINIFEEGNSTEEEPTPNSVQTVDLEVQVTGSYEAYNHLLLREQRNLRLFDLVSMTIGETQQAGDAGRNFSFALRFRAYYQR